MGSLNAEDCCVSAEENKLTREPLINLDQGNPTMFEAFWQKKGGRCKVAIAEWESMSYFSNVGNVCWFLVPELAEEIKKVHELVGNANTKDCHIVVGTGSSQLFQSALYALSPSDSPQPTSVVSSVPYYSPYPRATDIIKSGLHKWAGDASTFDGEEPYIEVVTSPSNPDGFMREAVVARGGGKTIYDLAYYWPHYTPITLSFHRDVMLFTLSKLTGHAGLRIGWALVKDEEVAKKMTEFIIVGTIGVSRDSQFRAAKILSNICKDYEGVEIAAGGIERLFEYGNRIMAERWKQLREVINKKPSFLSLPIYPSAFCNFLAENRGAHPAFAWLKFEGEEVDGESILKSYKILTRGGAHFGVSKNYVRVSLLEKDETFNIFLQRLSSIN